MSETHFADGFGFLRQGKFSETVAAFEEAIKDRPDFMEAHFNLALAYLTWGDKNKPDEIYTILGRLDPSLAAELREEIARRR